MKNSDAAVLLREILAVERKRKRFYTVAEINFINMVKEPINDGKDIGPKTGIELQRIYRKSQGG